MGLLRDDPTRAVIRQGVWETGMPYVCLGTGPPMVFLPGLSAHHHLPTGTDLRFQLGQVRPFTTHRQVWWVNRRQGLRPDVTMGDLAQDYADVIRSQFDGPVDILGVSTGGSIALQLAADHPGLVRRLVLVSSAYRLGPRGRAAQRRAAEWLRAGRSRRASAAEMAMLGATTLTQRMLGVVGWVFGTTGLGAGDPDMLATIDAEDGFDLRDRLGEITAPALVVGGERDAFYGPDLFTETAALIPRGQLMLYRRKGHLGTQLDRRLATDVLAFLAG